MYTYILLNTGRTVSKTFDHQRSMQQQPSLFCDDGVVWAWCCGVGGFGLGGARSVCVGGRRCGGGSDLGGSTAGAGAGAGAAALCDAGVSSLVDKSSLITSLRGSISTSSTNPNSLCDELRGSGNRAGIFKVDNLKKKLHIRRSYLHEEHEVLETRVHVGLGTLFDSTDSLRNYLIYQIDTARTNIFAVMTVRGK